MVVEKEYSKKNGCGGGDCVEYTVPAYARCLTYAVGTLEAFDGLLRIECSFFVMLEHKVQMSVF